VDLAAEIEPHGGYVIIGRDRRHHPQRVIRGLKSRSFSG
jgi:hypothetical protein